MTKGKREGGKTGLARRLHSCPGTKPTHRHHLPVPATALPPLPLPLSSPDSQLLSFVLLAPPNLFQPLDLCVCNLQVRTRQNTDPEIAFSSSSPSTNRLPARSIFLLQPSPPTPSLSCVDLSSRSLVADITRPSSITDSQYPQSANLTLRSQRRAPITPHQPPPR